MHVWRDILDAVRVTKAQARALEWLRARNGTGVWEKPGATVLIAAGERAPFMRSTWNALRDAGLISIVGRRVTIIEEA